MTLTLQHSIGEIQFCDVTLTRLTHTQKKKHDRLTRATFYDYSIYVNTIIYVYTIVYVYTIISNKKYIQLKLQFLMKLCLANVYFVSIS